MIFVLNLRSFCHAHFYQKGINQHLKHHAPSIGPNPEIPYRWVPLPPISSNDCAPQPSQWHPWKSKFSEWNENIWWNGIEWKYSMVDINVRFHSKIDFQIRFAILFPVLLNQKTIPLINHFQSQSVEWTSNIFAHQKFGPDQHSLRRWIICNTNNQTPWFLCILLEHGGTPFLSVTSLKSFLANHPRNKVNLPNLAGSIFRKHRIKSSWSSDTSLNLHTNCQTPMETLPHPGRWSALIRGAIKLS